MAALEFVEKIPRLLLNSRRGLSMKATCGQIYALAQALGCVASPDIPLRLGRDAMNPSMDTPSC